jgi:hypothetical protein
MNKLVSKTLRGVLGACALFAFTAGGVHAAAVPPSFGDPVYEKVAFIVGDGTFNEAFTVDFAGNYQASITDFGVPERFDFLLFAVTTTKNVMGSMVLETMSGPGTPDSKSFTFFAEPGITYFANIAGSSSSAPFALGLFGAEVTYVPIPAAAALLLSALLGLLVVARRRSGGGSAAASA